MYVTGIEALKGNSKKYIIHIEGCDDLCLYSSDIKKLGIKENTEISADTHYTIMEEILIPRAKKRALHLLERQDLSRASLREKLVKSHYPDNICDEAIAYVESYHYIDDERYADNYISYHKSDRTKRRLKQDLLKRGIDCNLIERAIDEGYDTDEADLARRLLEKKGYAFDTSEQKEKARMYRFLASRGFDSGVISSVL